MANWKVTIESKRQVQWQYEALPFPAVGKFRKGKPHTKVVVLWNTEPSLESAMSWAAAQAVSLGLDQAGISVEQERPESEEPKKYHIVTIASPFAWMESAIQWTQLKYYVRGSLLAIQGQIKERVDALVPDQSFAYQICEEAQAT